MRLAALFPLILPCTQAFFGSSDQISFSVVTPDVSASAVKQSEENASFSIASLSSYSLRVASPDPFLCDSTVKQHIGFLDVTDGKHLFYWFFESRTAPAEAPLTLWLNGGPGGSSLMGMLLEVGPCTIANNGTSTKVNPYSWNRYSNMIFLDQPVGVGFSYSTDNSTIDNTPDAAQDVWAFLQLFHAKFPQYASVPFHIAAESYGGTYGPHIGSTIYRKNQQLVPEPSSTFKHLNLASIILVNGHTNPKVQLASVPGYVCDGPYALLDPIGPECVGWKEKLKTCQRLVQTCYDFGTPLTCIPADLYCTEQAYAPLIGLKRNPYDVRQKCENPSPRCYLENEWVETWLNNTNTQKAIGLDPTLRFTMINSQMNDAFHARGDSVHNAALLLPPLIEDGIRVLVLAGMTDMMCNFMGNEAWVEDLENKFHDEFKQSEFLPWVTQESHRRAGEVRYAGGAGSTAGNLTFVKVYEVGHMVPHDQPEAALDLFSRWIFNTPLH